MIVTITITIIIFRRNSWLPALLEVLSKYGIWNKVIVIMIMTIIMIMIIMIMTVIVIVIMVVIMIVIVIIMRNRD